MTTLQLIIKKAKALRKAAPKKYAKWTDYVKAASATIKPKKKATVSGIKKKAAPKKVVKKAAPKKVVRKKATSIHKDSKSHNVNIRVMSGINPIENLNRLVKEKEKTENRIEALKVNIKKGADPITMISMKFWLNKYKKYYTGLKKQITEAKKYV
jgi:enoyl reductase-like protein